MLTFSRSDLTKSQKKIQIKRQKSIYKRVAHRNGNMIMSKNFNLLHQQLEEFMKEAFHRFLLTALFTIVAGLVSVNSQTILAVQDFETTPATPTWTYSNTGGAVSNNAGASPNTPANQRIRSGSFSYQVNSGTGTLNFDPITIPMGYSSVKAIVHISSVSANGTNGADSADNVRVFTALNGGAFPASPDITVQGNTNSRWSYNDAVNVQTTAGTPVAVQSSPGTNQGTIYSTLVVNIPAGTTSVALRVIAFNNDANEIWNVDDVTLTGVLTPSAASVSIGGRVLGANYRPINRALVYLTDQSGETKTAMTNAFGYYRFQDINVGQTYTLNVFSKRYLFDPQILTVNEEMENLNFLAQPER